MGTSSVKTMNDIALKARKMEYSIDPLFIGRWSPRAMSGEKIPREKLMSLFEAARWAPSSYNSQPWKFIFAEKDGKDWNNIFGLLAEFNQGWTINASALAVVVSKKTFDKDGKYSRTHSYDAGAAWANLALQGHLMGLVVHGMSGFDYDKARKVLNVPEDHDVEAMFAVGRPGIKENLPQAMQQMEIPSTRKSVSEFAFEGRFGG